MKISWCGGAIAAFGIVVSLVAAFADQIGLGLSPVFGTEQLLALIGGWASFVVGLWLALRFGRSKRGGSPVRSWLMLAVLILPIVLAVGAWAHTARKGEATSSSRKQGFLKEALVSIGYLDWSTSVANPEDSGLRRWDPDRTSPGYTLISSRVRREIYLIDLGGRIVHAWSFPEAKRTLEGVLLLESGDLLVISKYAEVLRLDWNSNLVWRVKIEAHHDIARMADGHLLTWVREIRPYRGLRVRFPYLAKITDDGRVIDRWSTREHLDQIKQAFDQRSFLDRRLLSLHINRIIQKLQGRRDPNYDYFHPNTVQPIGRNAHQEFPEFRPGNLLICFRNINQIATLDPHTMEILWTWGEGELEWPHHPTMLENGNILIFDNGTQRKYTRVLEIDPTTGRSVWQYPPDPLDLEHRFYSPYKGSAQRLGNGNTLIGDAENGRSIEVTPDGQIVWEFFYPELNSRGQRAAIYRSIRYPEPMIDRLIEARGANLRNAPAW